MRAILISTTVFATGWGCVKVKVWVWVRGAPYFFVRVFVSIAEENIHYPLILQL